jgi:hypothetical protein
MGETGTGDHAGHFKGTCSPPSGPFSGSRFASAPELALA